MSDDQSFISSLSRSLEIDVMHSSCGDVGSPA